MCPRDIFTFASGKKINFLSAINLPMYVYLFTLWYSCKGIVFYSEWGDFSETWQKLLKNVSPWHIHFWKWPENQHFETYKFAHGGISFHIMVFLQKNSVSFGTKWPFWNMTKIVRKCVPVTYSLLKMARKSTFCIL